MRDVRLVGLSPDGKSLIVATESGEELAVAVDERLRAALRGDRPRLGQLETEMDSSLSPRDIQTRIRAGATLEDVARIAGMPLDRVERFAAPVLAEREHVAAMAMTSSVRRRGETSGHRNLRVTVTERLVARDVDIDTMVWDSFRQDDGRWTITADYRFGEADRHATFTFDQQARFSVAANDEARWLLGEQSAKGPLPGRRRTASDEGEDTDPTLDLSETLALVRAVQPEEPEPRLAVVRNLDPRTQPGDPVVPEPAETGQRRGALADSRRQPADEPEDTDDEPVVAPSTRRDSPLETEYEVLGGDGYTEDSPRVYAGLADAVPVPEPSRPDPRAGLRDVAAVPVTGSEGWEPAIVVNYPDEPDEADDAGPVEAEPAHPPARWQERPASAEAAARRHGRRTIPEPHLRGTDEPGRPDRPTGIEDRTDEAQEFEEEAEAREAQQAAEPEQRPAKRKRASVPSWDEIMFGGPKRR
jgi:Protein of unknown function (DUF3071)